MAPKPVNLALQGGGAHGAFAWGVLDRLLEKGEVKIRAITATSAGAMNAAVLCCGYASGKEEGARAALDAFWRSVSDIKSMFGIPDLPYKDAFPFIGEAEERLAEFAMALSGAALSPYQFNPFGLNPLRQALTRSVDFQHLKDCNEISLFISATNVRNGQVRVFHTHEVTADAVMASACLPRLFQAVEIDGEHYWDGGYIGNPALWPLFYETDVQDLLVVHLNPVERLGVPKTTPEIENRLNEITFNTALLKELRAVAFVQKLLREGWLKDEFKDRLSDIRMHGIRADQSLQNLALTSKFNTDWAFLTGLKERGRKAADEWLERHLDDLGERETVNLHKDFLD